MMWFSAALRASIHADLVSRRRRITVIAKAGTCVPAVAHLLLLVDE
jgi:hypothetical protein